MAILSLPGAAGTSIDIGNDVHLFIAAAVCTMERTDHVCEPPEQTTHKRLKPII